MKLLGLLAAFPAFVPQAKDKPVDPAVTRADIEATVRFLASDELAGRANAMARRLARTEGLMVGISAAANVAASLKVAYELKQGVVVTILCDSAAKYLQASFWQEGQAGDGI